MAKFRIRVGEVIYWNAILGVDILVFIILGLLLMCYDDKYDFSKGEYLNLLSMNSTEKVIYIIYNDWILLNTFGLFYLAGKVYRNTRNNAT